MTAPLPVTARVMAALPAAIRTSLVALFVGTTACSLVMSANATMTYAAAHHVPAGIVWAPVGILELVQIAGTVWWLVSAGWSRAGAVLMVAGTAAVTAVMSCTTYGWLGLIAPVGMVATIHAIACVIRADQQVTGGHDLVIDQQVPRLDGWTKRRARDRARELGVSQAGTVGEIVARITAAEKVAS